MGSTVRMQMSEYLHSYSQLWYWVDKTAELERFLLPFLSFITALIIARSKNWWAYLALSAACLALLSRIYSIFFVDHIAFITLPHPQPLKDQNPIVFFIELHAEKIGLLIYALTLLGFVASEWRSKSGSSRFGDED
jgi:hypothetical protein